MITAETQRADNQRLFLSASAVKMDFDTASDF